MEQGCPCFAGRTKTTSSNSAKHHLEIKKAYTADLKMAISFWYQILRPYRFAHISALSMRKVTLYPGT
jgi:hypothetical protein